MGSIVLDRTDVVVGVDTHKREHTAVAVDGLGGRLGEMTVPANGDGYADILEWAIQLGEVHAWGVEGTGSYGSGLARFLRRHGTRVLEVTRPPRKDERRASGKSDVIDAEHAARQVLSGDATATPKLSEGQVESIRLLKVARDTAVRAQFQTIIALRATLVTASDEMRSLVHHSEHLGDCRVERVSATTPDGLDHVAFVTHQPLVTSVRAYISDAQGEGNLIALGPTEVAPAVLALSDEEEESGDGWGET